MSSLETLRMLNEALSVIQQAKDLVRRLDVGLNGIDGAAQQASLCDIVAQVEGSKVDLIVDMLSTLSSDQKRELVLKLRGDNAARRIG